MINFIYKNDAGIEREEQERAEQSFKEQLGDMAALFEELNGKVEIDFKAPRDSSSFFMYYFDSDAVLSEFQSLWQQSWAKRNQEK